MAADSQFFIRFNVDLTQAEQNLKKFVATAEQAKAKAASGTGGGSARLNVPQIANIPSLPQTRSTQAVGANLAVAQREFAQTLGLTPGSRQATEAFRASETRRRIISDAGLQESPELSRAQGRATRRLNELVEAVGETAAAQKLIRETSEKVLSSEGQIATYNQEVANIKRQEAAANRQQLQQERAQTASQSAETKAQAENAKVQQQIANRNRAALATQLAKVERLTDPTFLATSGRAAELQGAENQRQNEIRRRASAEAAASGAAIRARAQTALIERRNAALLGADIAKREAVDQALLRAKAQRLVAEKKAANQLQRITAQEARAQGLGRFQSYQLGQAAAGRGGPGAGGFFAGGALSTLRYALPGAALFGGARFISQGVKEAEELQRAFVTLNAQLEAIGRTDAFEGLRDDLLGLARETGIAADELADIAIQVQGAFGDNVELQTGTGDFIAGQELVEQQLEAAAKLTRISGLTKENVVNDLSAASFAFESTGERIGDVAVKIQDEFGVAVNETLDFLGQVGPVAQEAGFGLEEFAVIAAITQQRSGRSGSALAESFGRVLPAITQQREELLKLAAVEDALNTDEFLTAVGESDIRTIFLTLAGQFDNLSSSSQDFVENLLGGRREAQAIIPALSQASRIQEATADVTEDSAGLLDQRFGAVAETLGVQLERLGEKIQQVFLELLEAGLIDALEAMVDLADLLATAFGAVLGGVGEFNDLLGGTPAKIATITAAVFALNKAVQALNLSSTLGGLGGGGVAAGGLRQRAGQFGTRFATRAQLFAGAAGYAGTFNNQIGSGATLAAIRARPGAVAGGFAAGTRQAINQLPTGLAVAGAGLASFEAARRYLDARNEADARVADLVEAGSTKTQQQIQEIREEVEGNNELANLNQFLTGGKSVEDSLDDIDQVREAPARQNALEKLKTKLSDFNSQDREELFSRLVNVFSLDQQELAGVLDGVVGEGGFYEFGDLDPGQQATVLRGVIDAAIKDIEADPAANRAEEFFDAIGDEGFLGQVALLFEEQEIAAVNVAQNRQERKNRRGKELAERAEDVAASYEQLKSGYQAGLVSAFQYADALQGQIDILEETLALAGQDQQLLTSLRLLKAEQAKILSEAVIADQDLFLEFASLNPNQFGPQQELNLRIGNLSEITDPDQLRGALNDIFQIRQSVLEERVNAADTAEEAIAIANAGVQLTDEERVAVVRAQLNLQNREWAAFMQVFTDLSIELADGFEETLAEALALGGAANEIALAKIQETRERLLEQLEEYRQTSEPASRVTQSEEARRALEQLDEAERALREGGGAFGVQTVDRITADSKEQQEKAAEEAKKEAEEARKRAQEIRDARFEYLKALAGTDEIAAARIDIQQAQQQLAEADGQAEWYQAAARLEQANNSLRDAYENRYKLQLDLWALQTAGGSDPIVQANAAIALAKYQLSTARNEFEWLQAMIAYEGAVDQLQDAQDDIFNAQLELRAASVGGDPLRAAIVGVDQARAAYNQAQGEADRIRAQAQRIQAERSVVDAVKDIWDAQQELILAQANFAGETVEAAQQGLKTALANLEFIRGQYARGEAGQADVIRAEAEVVNAQAAARDAQLQDRLGDYEFLFEMEKITKSQLIQYLQSLKQIPDLTQDQIRDIDRRIKQLNDELGADLQFNLPSQIAPTLYEARRLSQARDGFGNPAGYQDNRINTITINVNNGTDEERMVEVLNDALGTNSRFGNQVRRY